MKRDSVQNTLIVATVLCVVCSVLVSGAAVGLRSTQEANKTLDRNKNVLLAAGLIDDEGATPDRIKELFEERIFKELVNLETGQAIAESEAPFDAAKYDPRVAAKDPKWSVEIPADVDAANIKRREQYSFVYKVNDERGKLQQVVVPMYGKGLWSTLYGFLALEANAQTVDGITYYEHGETPGLGGEVENKEWQAKWVDKLVYDERGEVGLSVIKGAVDADSPRAPHQVDGLSGATITSNGVTNMIQYWLGPHAFGPYLERMRPARNTESEESAGG